MIYLYQEMKFVVKLRNMIFAKPHQNTHLSQENQKKLDKTFPFSAIYHCLFLVKEECKQFIFE